MSRLGWLLLCLVGSGLALVGVILTTANTAVAQHDPTPSPDNTLPAVWGDPHIGFVVDTRGSMAAELDALNEAWSPQNIVRQPLTATYHLAAFKEDQAIYRGNTTSPIQLNNWLTQLEASGGEGCKTAALPGILRTLRNMPASKTPASDVLVISDGTPQGTRQNYAYVLDRLLRRGVRWHMQSSGWCNEGQPSLEQAQLLAERTGGTAFAPLQPAEYLTETIITLNQLLAEDTILRQQGQVNNETVIIPFRLGDASDFRIETTTGSWTGCLTCTVVQADTAVVPTSLEFQLIDPNGNSFYDASSPDLLLHQTSARTQLSYTGCLTCIDFKVGNWQLVVSGSGAYEVNIKANTGLHMANLSQRQAAVGEATPLRVALRNDPHAAHDMGDQPTPRTHWRLPLTATFRLVSLDGLTMRTLDLFDDGKNNDGLAGDGLYGGQVTVNEPGYWRVMVTGVLSSGTELEPFMRLDPTPVQFQRPRSKGPGAGQTVAGSTRLVNFSLTNSSDGATRAAQTMSFDIGVYSEQGWVVTDTVPLSVTLAPDETVTIPVEVVVPDDAPAGTVEETTFVAVPLDDFTDSSTAVVETTVIDQHAIYLPLVTR
ncbi:MAG: hypothetical protein KDD89_07455 [Anaerolineales bacterium]|nr:hypothetical protein [Anaerolineales bacterium]